MKKKVGKELSKDLKSNDATDKGGSIMKKALDKAISKGGKTPQSPPEAPIKKQSKKKISPKKTSSKGIKNMKK